MINMNLIKTEILSLKDSKAWWDKKLKIVSILLMYVCLVFTNLSDFSNIVRLISGDTVKY